MILPQSFYIRTDVVKIAKELLGKVLVTNIDGIITAGMITETEAYAGVSDKASHAYGGRRTARTEVMYNEGGCTYVYLCYGIHYLFNVVTNVENTPHAVLIRAVQPLEGLQEMLERRRKEKLHPTLTAGPGAMSQALGIQKHLNTMSLQGPKVYIEDRGNKIKPSEIVTATRIGVAYAAEDAMLPYRFYLKDNLYVSKRTIHKKAG